MAKRENAAKSSPILPAFTGRDALRALAVHAP